MQILTSNLAIVIFLGVVDLALIGLSKYHPSLVAAENGFVENLQLVVLLVTALVLISAAYRQTDALQAAAVALAGAIAAFFFRELEFRGLNLPEHLEFITSAWVRDPVFIAMILGVGIYMLVKRRWLPDWIALTLHPRALVFIGAVLFLAAGHFLDDLYGRTPWEEICELNGYLLFLAASIRHHQLR